MDRVGVIFGLGAVLSFGFWSTDFVLLQRMLAVRNDRVVQFVPLAQAAAKMVFAFLLVLPGLAAPLVLGVGHTAWNATLPSMMLHYYSPGWAAVGGMGLLACLISTYANNVSGFSAAWVQGVYRSWIRAEAGDRHYLWAGRLTNAAAIVASLGASWLALHYQSLMEYVQLILSIFNAPLCALVLLAALAPRRAAKGGLVGLTAGLVCAGAHQALAHVGWLVYGSQLNANFYAAILGFSVALAGTLAAGTLRSSALTCVDAMQSIAPALPRYYGKTTLLCALVIATACIAFNILFW
jgi:SSS family solute:Na+ symporter